MTPFDLLFMGEYRPVDPHEQLQIEAIIMQRQREIDAAIAKLEQEGAVTRRGDEVTPEVTR